jgi:hypothetical protein
MTPSGIRQVLEKRGIEPGSCLSAPPQAFVRSLLARRGREETDLMRLPVELPADAREVCGDHGDRASEGAASRLSPGSVVSVWEPAMMVWCREHHNPPTLLAVVRLHGPGPSFVTLSPKWKAHDAADAWPTARSAWGEGQLVQEPARVDPARHRGQGLRDVAPRMLDVAVLLQHSRKVGQDLALTSERVLLCGVPKGMAPAS